MKHFLRKQAGFALLELLIFAAILPPALLVASRASDVVSKSSQFFKSSGTKNSLNVVKSFLVTQAGNPESDGIFELPKDASGGSGGALPASLLLTTSDEWGTVYRYCNWDTGAPNAGNATLSQNAVGAPGGGVIGQVISAGKDKTFQTACGVTTAAGDDVLVNIYNSDVLSSHGGIGGWKDNTSNITLLNPADNVGLGVDAPTHKLELAAGTTPAAGLALGEVEVYRSAANVLALSSGNSLDLDSGSLRMGGSTVIDSSRNLTGNNLTLAGGLLTMNNATSNMIMMGSVIAPPSTVARSAGTRLVLYPSVGGGLADHAIGVDNGTFWSSVSANSNANYFKWYGGAANVMTLDGAGHLGVGVAPNAAYSVNSLGAVNASAYYVNGVLTSSSLPGTVAGQTLYWDGTNWSPTSGFAYNSATGAVNVATGPLQMGGVTVFDASRNLVGANAVGQNLIPGANSTYSLGSGAAQWLNVYSKNLYQDGNQVADVFGGSIGYLPKFTSLHTIGNSQIYDNGNGVGIGFATPGILSGGDSGARLELVTTGAAGAAGNGALRWYGDNGTYVGWIAKADAVIDGNTWGDARLSFTTPDGTGAPRQTLTLKTGNVGIGTTNPQAKLSVYKPDQTIGVEVDPISYAGARIFAYNRSVPGAKDLLLNDPGGAVIIGANANNGTGATLQVNGVAYGSAFATPKGRIDINSPFTGDGFNIAGYGNTFLGTTGEFFLGFATNNNEQMRILPNGNVGIGTPTPARKLHVVGSAVFGGSGGADTTIFDQPGLGSIGTNGNYPFALLSNGTEKARLTTTGEFFLGRTTTDGVGLLQVGGDISLDANHRVRSNSGMLFLTGFADLVFESGGAGLERGRFASSGAFLVGTTTDDGSGAKVQVYQGGAVANPAMRFRYNATSYFMDVGLDAGGDAKLAVPAANGVSSGNFRLSMGNTSLVRVLSDATTLINTAVPDGTGAKLQVAGDVSVNGNAYATGYVQANGGIYTAGPIYRNAAGTGYLNGNYNSYETINTSGAIYSIGGAYVPAAASLGNMYGIGYGYSGHAGISATGAPINHWGMYVASNGVSRIFLDSDSGSIYTNGGAVFGGSILASNGGGYYGPNYFYSNKGAGTYLISQNNPGLQAVADDGGSAFMSFWRVGQYAVNFGLDPDNVLRIGGWSVPANLWSLNMEGSMAIRGQMNASSASGTGGYISSGNYGGTGNASWHPAGIYSGGPNWLYGTVVFNGTVYGATSFTADEIYSNGWLRNTGSLTGLVNQINNNYFYSESGAFWTVATAGAVNGGIKFRTGHQGTIMGYVYHDSSGFGLLHKDGNWSVKVTPTTVDLYGATTVNGNLSTTGNITASGTVTGSSVYNAVYN